MLRFILKAYRHRSIPRLLYHGREPGQGYLSICQRIELLWSYLLRGQDRQSATLSRSSALPKCVLEHRLGSSLIIPRKNKSHRIALSFVARIGCGAWLELEVHRLAALMREPV